MAEPNRASESDRPALFPGRSSPIVEALEQGAFHQKASRFRHVVLPILLLAAGAPLAWGTWYFFLDHSHPRIQLAVWALTVQVLLLTPLAFVALLLVTRWFDLGLGSLVGVVGKTLALVLGPLALADSVLMCTFILHDFEITLIVICFGYYLLAATAPTMGLFEMSLYEALTAVLLFYLPRLAVLLALTVIVPGLFPK